MALEIATVVLCLVALAGILFLLLIALAGVMDPTTYRRCQECGHAMVDTRHRPEAVCFHCRHSHHPLLHKTFAHLPSLR